MGRKMHPVALKLARGNPGKRPLPQPVVAPSDAPDCPAWMPLPGVEEWNRLVPALSAMGLLSSVDLGVLASYCLSWAELTIAIETLKAEGRTIVAANGAMARHPQCVTVAQSIQQIRSLASELGLTPSARTRLGATGDKKDVDPLQELMG